MVQEMKIIFRPSDVSNIRFTCVKCGAEVVYSISSMHIIPTECPSCQTVWNSPDCQQERDFLKAFRNMCAKGETRIEIHLEMDGLSSEAQEG